jgi:hypothetical protein
MKAEDFVGTWRACGTDYRAKDGTITQSTVTDNPTDASHPGRIVYTADGTVIVLTTPANRRKFGGQFASGDLSSAPVEQRAEAANGVIAYAGHYEVDGERVLHLVEIAFLPDWVGTTNVRVYRFEGRRLILSTPPDAQGGVRRIHWQRV